MPRRLGETRSARTWLHQRGSTLNGVLIGTAILGGFVLTALLVRPAIIHARAGGTPAEIAELSPERRHVLEAIAALIQSSGEIIAIHDRTEGSPLYQIVLRLPSPQGDKLRPRPMSAPTHSPPGAQELRTQHSPPSAPPVEFIRPEQIIILAHSRVLQALLVYVHGEAGPGAGFSEPHVRRSEVLTPEFAAYWRSHPAVTRHVLAAGISDVHIGADARGRSDVTSASRVVVALTWAAESADGEQEAAAQVDLRR